MKISSFKPFKRMEVSDNYFRNFNYTFSDGLMIMDSKLSNFEAKNNTFESCMIDSVFTIMTQT